MAAVSEFVVDEADVEAVQDDGDTASARLTFQVEHLEQRVIRYAPGRSGARMPEGRHELLYVVAGVGELELDGDSTSPRVTMAGGWLPYASPQWSVRFVADDDHGVAAIACDAPIARVVESEWTPAPDLASAG